MSVREGLLALLADGPRNGHQLKVEFEAATGGVWPLNVGQVYTTLDRLARDGLVDRGDVPMARARPNGKRYELTAAGREELAGWWQLVPADDPPPRDELMLKVLFATTLGSRHALDGHHRAAHGAARALAERTGAAPSQPPPTTTSRRRWFATRLIVRAEADLRWLDLCEARLDAPKKGRSR